MADIEAARIYVPVETNADKATASMGKLDSSFGKLDESLKKLTDSMEKQKAPAEKQASTIGDIKTSTLLAVAAIKTAVGAFKSLIKVTDDGQRTEAQLAAVIKSTGAAVGYTTNEMESMAAAFSEQTGIEDDSIARSEALLATFTKIGHDTFPKAEQAILDMSAALGQDLQGASIQVGKALQHPAEGLSALGRAGVIFSAQQEEQVKAFMAVNDIASAQAVILKELNTEFGGAAAAMSDTVGGAFDKLGNTLDNMVEDIGNQLTPNMIDFASAVGTAAMEGGMLDVTFKGVATVLGSIVDGASTLVNLLSMASAEYAKNMATGMQNNALKQIQALSAETTKYYGTFQTNSQLQDKATAGDKYAAETLKKRTELQKTMTDATKVATQQSNISVKAQQTMDAIANGSTEKTIAEKKKLRDENEKFQVSLKKTKATVSMTTDQMKSYTEALKISAAAGDYTSALKAMDIEQEQNVKKLQDAGISTEFLTRRYKQLRDETADKIYVDIVQRASAANPLTGETPDTSTQLKYIEDAYTEQKAALDKQYSQGTIGEETYQSQLDSITKSHTAARTQIVISGVQSALASASTLMSSMSTLISGTMSAMSEYSNQVISNMQTTMEAEGKTDEEINKAVKKKRRELAKQEKSAKIATIILNTAAGVTGALSQSGALGSPLAIANAALIGVLGAVQLGYAMATPLPAAAYGGNFQVNPGYEGDSGLLRVSSGENVSVTPARYSDTGASNNQTMILQVGDEQMTAYVNRSTNRGLNSGQVQIRKKGSVKIA